VNESIRVGMIGLGAMGAPMARHLAAAGLLRAVWNRSRERAESLASELGVTVSDTPFQLAEACQVVVICVSADADVLSVIEQMGDGLRTGSTVVDTSTISPVVTRDIARDLAQRGVGFVDAPLSGGVEGAINGRLSVMAGGESADFERILPVLEAFSARVTHMGPAGSGQATKAVNQVIVGGVAEAVCEALALSEKLNLPPERLLSVLGAGAAGSWFLQHRGQSMLEDRFEKGFKLSLLLKDLKIIRSLARELDIPMQGVEMAIRDYQRLVEAGDGDKDISGLITLKRESLNRDSGSE
jgi:3-hydroxyisobutyrate dehydrogenase